MPDTLHEMEPWDSAGRDSERVATSLDTTDDAARQQAVGGTSRLVAALRALESERSEEDGRLFCDPYARELAGPEIFQELAERGESLGPRCPLCVALRTCHFDERCLEALERGLRQFVVLAAGLDSRAFRLPLTPDARWFELDQPPVPEHKRQRLGRSSPHCERHELGCDLREDWTGSLVQAGFRRDEPTFWLIEGLLCYLTEEAVGTLLERVGTLSAPGSELACDFLSSAFIEPGANCTSGWLAERGAALRSGTDEPELFLGRHGWHATAVQALSDLRARGRWPQPPPPRDVRDPERTFFVHGTWRGKQDTA